VFGTRDNSVGIDTGSSTLVLLINHSGSSGGASGQNSAIRSVTVHTLHELSTGSSSGLGTRHVDVDGTRHVDVDDEDEEKRDANVAGVAVAENFDPNGGRVVLDGEECDEAELVGYGGNGKVDVKVECGVGSRHGMLVCCLEDGRSEMVLDVSVRSLRYLFESASFLCSR